MFVCLFVCLFVCSPTPPRSLGRSSPNLEGRWRAAPDISLKGSFLKGQGHRGQRSFFSVLFPYFSQVLGPIFTKLGGKVEGSPGYFLKGKGHRGQRSFFFFSVCSPTSPRSLGQSSQNLVGRLRAAPDISSRGSFYKGQGHLGQRSNFCISAVLGPICMKLGECIQVDP